MACSTHGGFQFRIRESDLLLEPIHLLESELFEVGKGSTDQNKHETKESLWRSF